MRTTAAQVEGILEVDPTLSLDPFIETANSLVTEICEPLGYSDSKLELIERWLSAHFYCQLDPRVVSESIGGRISATYEGRSGMNLKNTRYGQQALMLDTKGGLSQLDKERVVTPQILKLGDCS